MGRGKRLIIVDCITENGPIPGALWTFSTESKTKGEEKHDFQFIETAVAEKEITKMKTQTKIKAGRSNAEKTRPQLQVKRQQQ